jgi:hypothetical protein
MVYALKHPEYLREVSSDGSETFGCDQRWYRTKWQQMSGCGPTTASTILIYLQRSGRITLPVEVRERHECIALMEQVWQYVRPTARGIYLAEQFCGGIQKFAKAHEFEIACEALSICGNGKYGEERNILRNLLLKPLQQPRTVAQTDDLHTALEFIAAGLEQDTPIAFLNLASGEARDVDEWHWMTIVALMYDQETNRAEIRIIDGSKTISMDFVTWFNTTSLGGSLVYLLPQAEPETTQSRPVLQN